MTVDLAPQRLVGGGIEHARHGGGTGGNDHRNILLDRKIGPQPPKCKSRRAARLERVAQKLPLPTPADTIRASPHPPPESCR
jgi:hypothetical protein